MGYIHLEGYTVLGLGLSFLHDAFHYRLIEIARVYLIERYYKKTDCTSASKKL